ncbi:hypothetical protein [Leptolyngbya sp. FACHB-16]|uniref:hypothetical protein n=1 Tax=unclassified Leptolyngbya TaxID=2650499 RepID=UPI0016836E3D|nr:hypothetical protein [Leptolyngbya sp. FACHB-16]MBD2156852.1 hypothetical protein [Leptolyngbya sp. FACHB-16]
MVKWFRYCLYAAAFMNVMGSLAFIFPLVTQSNPLSMPEAHPLYLGTLSSWILIFGIAYAWMAFMQKPERLFIAVAAACKVAIAILFFVFWLAGDLSFLAASVGLGDLSFAIAFIYWLRQFNRYPSILD